MIPLGLGVCASSIGASEDCRNGELIPIPFAPFSAPSSDRCWDLFTGEDWKKRGDEVGGF